MSIEAMTAVLHHSKAKGTALIILLGIANHEGDGGAWPCRKTLAKYGRCSERRVKQIVGELAEAGELSVEHQAGGLADTDDYLRPNRYRVLVRCPAECDGTSQHRVRPAPSSFSNGTATGGKRLPPVAAKKRRGGSPLPPLRGKPTSPGGGEVGFPLTVPEEPSLRSEEQWPDSARSAPGVGAHSGKTDSAENPLPPPPPPGSRRSAGLPARNQWRSTDKALFETILGANFRSRGTPPWQPGVYPAGLLYQALRDGAAGAKKPIDWPGRFLSRIGEDPAGLNDWLDNQGFELLDERP